MGFLPYVLFARRSDSGSVSIGFLVPSPDSGMGLLLGFLKNFCFGPASSFLLVSSQGLANLVVCDLRLLVGSPVVYLRLLFQLDGGTGSYFFGNSLYKNVCISLCVHIYICDFRILL